MMEIVLKQDLVANTSSSQKKLLNLFEQLTNTGLCITPFRGIDFCTDKYSGYSLYGIFKNSQKILVRIFLEKLFTGERITDKNDYCDHFKIYLRNIRFSQF